MNSDLEVGRKGVWIPQDLTIENKVVWINTCTSLKIKFSTDPIFKTNYHWWHEMDTVMTTQTVINNCFNQINKVKTPRRNNWSKLFILISTVTTRSLDSEHNQKTAKFIFNLHRRNITDDSPVLRIVAKNFCKNYKPR